MLVHNKLVICYRHVCLFSKLLLSLFQWYLTYPHPCSFTVCSKFCMDVGMWTEDEIADQASCQRSCKYR